MLRCNDLCTIYSMRLNRREAFFSMQCMAVGAILLSRINGCSQTKGFATVQLVLLSDPCVFAHLQSFNDNSKKLTFTELKNYWKGELICYNLFLKQKSSQKFSD